jgi:ABC-type branched-subunit amino acid transport system permease subunit
VLALAIGLFSLRVRAIFFSMITLAVAAAFQTLASQLSDFTGGEDGLTFKMPEVLSPSFELSEPFLGVSLDGRLLCYYLLFVAALVLFLAMLRIVNSPFGRVLQAIRENEFRAEAIGYRVVVYRTVSSILSALFATLAGAMLAIWLRYNGPDTSLSFEIMLDVLLIVVIGGMGTIYGAAIGSGLFVVAQSYLQDLLKLASDAVAGLPWLAALLSPDRWLLWLGVLFVLSVYYFPTGIGGARCVRMAARHRALPRRRPRRPEKDAAMAFTSNYVTCAGREIHSHEWGAQGRVVIAWHGLARTGRDMDELAAALAGALPRVCPDTLGRGYSQWSPDPGNEYTLEFYARLAADLFDRSWHREGPLGRHLDGRGHRHRLRRRAVAAGMKAIASAAWC